MPQEGAAQPDPPPGAALHRPAVHDGHLGRAADDLHPPAHVHPLPHTSVSTDGRSSLRQTPGFTGLHVFQVAALGGKRGNVSFHGRRQVHAALHQERGAEDLQRPHVVLNPPGSLQTRPGTKGSFRLFNV